KLRTDGADVFCIDPFDANINYARTVRGLSNLRKVPMSSIHRLDLPWAEFDIVEALSVHVLAHTMRPRGLLSRVLSLLKPGGFLFLDEKDVFYPTKGGDEFILDTGRSHQYHLTQGTLGRYIRSTGFDLLECELDRERFSGMRHLRLVAQKPQAGMTRFTRQP